MDPLSPLDIFDCLLDSSECGKIYVAGGPVRDFLLGRTIQDMDLVLANDSIPFAESFSEKTDGRLVVLDPGEGVARVVYKGFYLDFSKYREGSRTIREDLSKRDFTINAMAVPLGKARPIFYAMGARADVRGLDGTGESLAECLIDPFGGERDCTNKVIKAFSRENLQSDPLRLLRAYRFSAQLGFSISDSTRYWMRSMSSSITRVAAERVGYELKLIMKSKAAHHAFTEMYRDGLLKELIPELEVAEGVEQPGFHHLDVLGHSFEALKAMEQLIGDPCQKFSLCEPLLDWISINQNLVPWLKWAALLHDTGKPSCRGEKDGRATFYHHDHKGSDLVKEVGARLRWPKNEMEFVARLVRMHMRPFHLLNDLRRGGPTKRAMRRLLDETGDQYPALFLLAMADSMSGCGPLKPADLDMQLSNLWERIHGFYQDRVKPVEKEPRWVNGHDIQELFGIPPGPLVGRALKAVQDARIDGVVKSKPEAIAWLKAWFEGQKN